MSHQNQSEANTGYNFAPPTPRQREELVRELMDPTQGLDTNTEHFPNYEYAKDSGLVEVFYYNPETGEDGLRHILEGDMIVGASGAREVSGYHHEPSGNGDDTYVDYARIEGRNSRELRDYRHFPYEPYNTHVVIKGYPKSVFRENEDGEYMEVSAKSSMFPKEYDALAVLQGVRIARDTRDKRADEPGYKGTIKAEGFVPLLDGKSYMRVRLILDSDTEKVITAFPLQGGRKVMGLGREAVREHLGLQ